MTPFLIYQLKVGIALSFFMILYQLFLRKETFYALNRFYLLATMIFAQLIPLIRLPIEAPVSNRLFPNLIDPVVVVAGETHFSKGTIHDASTLPFLQLIYCIVAAILITYLLYQLIHLATVIKSRGYARHGSYKIITLPTQKHSFSFFNYLFISSSDISESESNQILEHEQIHARQWHSLDILLINLFKIFQWFNPFFFLLQKSIQETHEYLADAAVLEHHGDTDRYKMLLLSQVFGIQPGILSFFNYSLIKKRLTMMTKEKSPSRNRLKYLAAIPLVMAVGMLCCSFYKTNPGFGHGFVKTIQTAVSSADPDTTQTTKTQAVEPPPPPPPPPVPPPVSEEENEPAYVFVEKQAQFQGGDLNTFRVWVQKNLVYPPEAVANKISGKIIIQFAVNSHGNVCDIKIMRGVDPSLDKEALRVIQMSPDWIPAQQEGNNVKQQFIMPILFALSGGNPSNNPNTKENYTAPKFQGNDAVNFLNWVMNQVVYPDDALKSTKPGQKIGDVLVSLTITSSGKPDNIQLLKTTSTSLDEQVLRIVRSSPDWEPAKKDGKAIDDHIIFNFPMISPLE